MVSKIVGMPGYLAARDLLAVTRMIKNATISMTPQIDTYQTFWVKGCRRPKGKDIPNASVR